MTSAMQDATVWITGGGSGLGRALALELARRGATVAVSGRRRERLDETVAAIEAEGGRALAVPCDVTDAATLTAAVAIIVEATGKLDVAVANAGYAASGEVIDTDLEVWRRQLDTNVLGVVATARAALPELIYTRGRLVLVGSVAGMLPVPGGGPYSVSKAAVAQLGEVLATELAGTGVTCTTIHPGFVESDIVQTDDLGRWRGDREDKRPAALLWKADDAARVMAQAIERRDRTYVFTGHGKLGAALGRHLPGLVHTALTLGRREPRATPPRPDELGVLPLVDAKQVELDRPLGHAALFARAALLAPSRPQGILEAERFPALSARWRGATLDAERIAAYREVCLDPGPDTTAPLAMPEILFLGVMGALVTHDAFPLSPFGLIHVRQTLTGHAPIRADERLDLTARVAEVRRTGKGYELDLALEVDRDGERAWEAVTTLLSRSPHASPGRRPRPPRPQRPEGTPVEARADTGRRYARVSDDWNPHHLWSFTAKPLGYDRPIAHGMWELAVLLGQVPDAVDTSTGRAEVAFKKPLLLPGTMQTGVVEDGDRWRLDAWDPRKGAPHVEGWFQPKGSGVVDGR